MRHLKNVLYNDKIVYYNEQKKGCYYLNAIHIRIGNNLRRIRKHRQLSLDKLANLTKVSKGMLHQIEQGQTHYRDNRVENCYGT